MSQIGIFFYIDGKVVSHQSKVQEGVQQGVFINPTESHNSVWRKNYQNELQKNYDFWPRGRVVYNTNSKQFIVYHEGCLIQKVLEEVREVFGIKADQVRYVKDEYYACHQCVKKFDLDEESMYYSF